MREHSRLSARETMIFTAIDRVGNPCLGLGAMFGSKGVPQSLLLGMSLSIIECSRNLYASNSYIVACKDDRSRGRSCQDICPSLHILNPLLSSASNAEMESALWNSCTRHGMDVGPSYLQFWMILARLLASLAGWRATEGRGPQAPNSYRVRQTGHVKTTEQALQPTVRHSIHNDHTHDVATSLLGIAGTYRGIHAVCSHVKTREGGLH